MTKLPTLSFKKIIETVAEFYDVSPRSIRSISRKKELTKARHVVMFLLREELHESYPRIGRRMGNRDHTTAIHAYEKIKTDLQKEPVLQKEIGTIRAQLRGEELLTLSKPKEIVIKKDEIVKEKVTVLESQLKEMLDTLRRSSPSFVTLEREKSMLEEWRSGKTLEQIGKAWKLTRERARQIITRGILREIAGKMNDGFEIDVGEFLKQEKRIHGKLRDRLSGRAETKEKKAGKPKRWTYYYDRCRGCGTTVIPHYKHGLCRKCAGIIEDKDKEEMIAKAGGKCEICGMDRISSFQEFGRDFYITRLSPRENPLSEYMVLCRRCFTKLAGKKMFMAKQKKKTAE